MAAAGRAVGRPRPAAIFKFPFFKTCKFVKCLPSYKDMLFTLIRIYFLPSYKDILFTISKYIFALHWCCCSVFILTQRVAIGSSIVLRWQKQKLKEREIQTLMADSKKKNILELLFKHNCKYNFRKWSNSETSLHHRCPRGQNSVTYIENHRN